LRRSNSEAGGGGGGVIESLTVKIQNLKYFVLQSKMNTRFIVKG
jgi:hypothetical protein